MLMLIFMGCSFLLLCERILLQGKADGLMTFVGVSKQSSFR